MSIVAGTPEDITYSQAFAIRLLHGELGRPCPELIDLTFDEAGDLIIKLRGELLAADGKDGA